MNNELDRIEKISIKFSNTLLNTFIDKVKEEFDIELLNTNDWSRLQEYQEEIRDLFIKYQSYLSFYKFPFKLDKSHNSHPNIFVLFLYLLARGKVDNWESLFIQTKAVVINEYDAICFEYSLGINTDSKCACNHSCYLTKQFIITNLKSGLSLLVGDDCVFKLITQERLDTLKKQRETNNFIRETLIKKQEEKKKIRKNEIKLKKLRDNFFSVKLPSLLFKYFYKQRIFELLKQETKRLKRLKLIPRMIIYKFCRNFLKEIKNNQVDLPKVKNQLGFGLKKRISYYAFFQYVKKEKKWRNYLTLILSPKYDTHLLTKLKIEKFSQKFK